MAEDEAQQSDWVQALGNRLESLVGVLRDYSLRPALGIARFLLLGAVALLVGSAVLLSILIALTKLFDDDVFSGRVWATDFLFGGILVIAGGLLFRAGVRRKGSSND